MSQADSESVIDVKFTVVIDVPVYAKRFGLDIPDDSVDAEIVEDSCVKRVSWWNKNVRSGRNESVVEDASVSYGAQSAIQSAMAGCKTSISQCQAKNPLTCRYHGAKVIAQDIEGALRAAGVNGKVNVQLSSINAKGVMEAYVEVKAKKSELAKVRQAMAAFGNNPGVKVDANNIGYMGGVIGSSVDIDTLDPNAKAKWGAGQQPPAPSASQAKPAVPNANNTGKAATQQPHQGNIDISLKNLSSLPQQPTTVTGGFYCNHNQLTSLKGAPQSVGGHFSCNINQLTSLKGAPQSVGGDFLCYGNKLTSLDGAPVKVGGKCDFSNNSGLTQQQINDYLAFLKNPDPSHIDATGHYVEKAIPKAQQGGQSASTQSPAPSQPSATPSPALAAPQPQSPTINANPNAPRLHPPIRPADPGAWNGVSEKDMDFLEESGMSLAYLAQRVNHNLATNHTPGAGKSALPGFQKIDEKRLRALASTNAQAARILAVYDDAKKSEANGWKDEITGGQFKYDESKYDANTYDPRGSTDYDSWKFDRDKVQGYAAWKKAHDAYANWENPADARSDFLKSVAGAPAKDIKSAKDSASVLADIEDNIGALEEAISKTADAGEKGALQAVLVEVEQEYYKADKDWNAASTSLKKWLSSQSAMQDSIADTISAIKARGEQPHPLLENWQSRVTANLKTAKSNLASRFKLTQQQVDNADKYAKINMKALAKAIENDECSVGTCCSEKDFMNMLDKNWPVGACMDAGSRYYPIVENEFGCTQKSFSRTQAASVFMRAMDVPMKKFPKWWTGYNQPVDCVIFPNIKKSIIAVTSDLYDGASKHGKNRDGSCATLMTDSNSCLIGGHITKEAFTQDLTNENGPSLMSKLGLDGGNEMFPIGGIPKEKCAAVKFFSSVPSFTAQQKNLIKSLGIIVYDSRGNEVIL